MAYSKLYFKELFKQIKRPASPTSGINAYVSKEEATEKYPVSNRGLTLVTGCPHLPLPSVFVLFFLLAIQLGSLYIHSLSHCFFF